MADGETIARAVPRRAQLWRQARVRIPTCGDAGDGTERGRSEGDVRVDRASAGAAETSVARSAVGRPVAHPLAVDTITLTADTPHYPATPGGVSGGHAFESMTAAG